MKGTRAGLLIDEFNFDQYLSQIEVQLETPEGEVTNLDSLGQEFIPLIPALRITFNGYYDGGGDQGTFQQEVEDRLATNAATVTALIDKSVMACVAYVLPTCGDYEMAFGFPAGGVATLNGKWSGANARRGYRVWTGAIAATGEKTGVDFTTGVTTGGKAFLHVTAIAGTATNAAIKVQSSANNTDWDDEGTFTIGAVGAQTLTLTGTVGRYIRINCTDLGGATSITCQVIVSLG